MKIVVTGHKGYIGSEIYFYLQMLGYSVIGIDKKEGKSVITSMPVCDVAIHCASSLKNEGSLEYNMKTTQPVINKAKKIVFLSSAAVYGNNKLAIEKSKINPINEYGISKVTCEELIIKSKKPHVIFRLANVYSLHAKHGVISRFLKGHKTINGDGKKTRDFVRLEDIVPVIVEAAITNKWRGVYNLSSGKGISMLNLYKRFFPNEKPIFKPEVDDEIIYSILDNTKALKKGFRPL